MDVVTYPRAPARMMPITSSAASDTESARNCVVEPPAESARTPSITPRPPPGGVLPPLRAGAGWVGDVGQAAGALQAPDDQIGDPPPVGRHLVGVESGAK